MTDVANIRETAERNAKLLALKPERGHLTAVTTARKGPGLHCEIAEGPWRLTADLPAKAGGGDTAPTPGMLGRGALASCLVIGISMWAARLGVPIDALEVEVQADFDARGELGVGDATAGYEEVRYRISIDSPADAQTVAALIEKAERHSPYLDVFSRGQTLTRALRLNGEEV